MPVPASSNHIGLVALLAEGVDRNIVNAPDVEVVLVALLAEGVDRNLPKGRKPITKYVALLAEGVDRNNGKPTQRPSKRRRPPRGGRG